MTSQKKTLTYKDLKSPDKNWRIIDKETWAGVRGSRNDEEILERINKKFQSKAKKNTVIKVGPATLAFAKRKTLKLRDKGMASNRIGIRISPNMRDRLLPNISTNVTKALEAMYGSS